MFNVVKPCLCLLFLLFVNPKVLCCLFILHSLVLHIMCVVVYFYYDTNV